MKKGYRRLKELIQTKMLACTLDVEEPDVLQAVRPYTEALMLLS